MNEGQMDRKHEIIFIPCFERNASKIKKQLYSFFSNRIDKY